MQFVFGLNALQSLKHTGVLTMGAFDGLHLGHQHVLSRLLQRARSMQLAAGALVFEPQPAEYFLGDKAPPRLMGLREKVQGFADLGLDYAVCLRFNTALRQMSAREFVETVLVAGLRVQHVIIGDDFRFGCDRQGDYAFLQSVGAALGFSVENSQTLSDAAGRISSTRIREAVHAGALAEAESLLGRPYWRCGRVIYGRQLGRDLGFPTLNIKMGSRPVAVSGVYVVWLWHQGQRYPGIANVGRRPTVSERSAINLEVHVLDNTLDLYGEFVRVDFLEKVREEQTFPSLEDLQIQIRRDAECARVYFAKLSSSSDIH